jgi:hypothetical protein
MSIIVAVASPEGIVFVADSRTTIQRRDQYSVHYRVASESAEKLYLAQGRFGVATYGLAMIGGRTIRSLMDEFWVARHATVEEYANALGEFFTEQIAAATTPRRVDLKLADLGWPLGFFVAGYDDIETGVVLDVAVRGAGPRITEVGVSTRNPGVASRGQNDAIERMLHGVDWTLLQRAGIEVSDDLRERLELLHYDLIDPQTVDDAASFAEFLANTQMGMQEFSDGTIVKPKRVPGCGGKLRTLAVTRTGARWLSNASTPLSEPEINQEANERADAGPQRATPSGRSAQPPAAM